MEHKAPLVRLQRKWEKRTRTDISVPRNQGNPGFFTTDHHLGCFIEGTISPFAFFNLQYLNNFDEEVDPLFVWFQSTHLCDGVWNYIFMQQRVTGWGGGCFCSTGPHRVTVPLCPNRVTPIGKSSAACNGPTAPRLERLVFLYEKGKITLKSQKNMLRGMRGCMSAVQSQEGDTLGQQSRGRAGRRTPPRSPVFLVVQHLIHATVVSCHHIPFYQVLVRFLQAVRSNRATLAETGGAYL